MLQLAARLFVVLALALAARPVSAEPRVEMDLAFEPGFPIAGQQRWSAALENVGVANLRIRQARQGDKTEIETSGSGDSALHRVTGILTADNKLVLPAGSFSLQDQARISEWVARLKAGGIQELTAPRTSFGLTEPEFAALKARLAAPLTFSTKDQLATGCVKSLVRGLTIPVTVTEPARAAVESDWRIREDLEGMSQGTALAAMLRPLGLGFAPQREIGGKVSLKIAPQHDLRELWPVGWSDEEKAKDLMPDLFKFLNVEIADTPLSEAMAAIEGRLNVPFLYDHNNMARDRIEPSQINVSLPAGRTFYNKILRQLLFQAKLKADLRADEAGKPFLWITTIRP
jgi:hypothetical protein